MAEQEDRALLLRRIPYSETSLICHLLTERYGRIAVMARGARRPKSAFRATLEPLHELQIGWRPGRSGMGTLTQARRGRALLPAAQMLAGLELTAIVSRLFQEGDPHGYQETQQALALLAARGGGHALLAAVWQLLDAAGWRGDLMHCWQCGDACEQTMHWRGSALLCGGCGQGAAVSVGMRKSAQAILAGEAQLCMHADDADLWRRMIGSLLREHGIRVTDTFR